MIVRKGQYFYLWSGKYQCYRIYKADEDCKPPHQVNCSAAYNEAYYHSKEEAMARVCELNGWEYDVNYKQRKQTEPRVKDEDERFREFCKNAGL